MELCRLCEIRKPRRACPAVGGDICTLCCGEQREVTLDCPLDCEYLLEARRREKPPEVNPDEFPNKEIRVTEDFLRDHEQLLVFAARALLNAALATPGAGDNDVREAIDALIRTYRTMDSGLIYQTRPQNPYAASVQQLWLQSLEQFRTELHKATGMYTIRDSELLGTLVFLQRLEIQHNNGRRRSRAFLSFLLEHFPQREERLVAEQ